MKAAEPDFAVRGARGQAPLQDPPVHEWRLPDGAPWTEFHRTAEGYLVRFPGLVDFTVSRDGARVEAHPVPQVPQETVRHLYLNQVLPLALGARGMLVFHAAAVEIDGAAAAFMGASGAGKSTLAAAFATSGSRFLTDDGLVVDLAEGEPLVAPSHPSIRLWDDSREALVGAGTAAMPAAHFTRKGRFLAGDSLVHCGEPRRLSRIYLLGADVGEPGIRPVSAAEAAIELVRHSFLIDIGERALLATHFERLSDLANRVPCFRLDYPRQYEALAQVRAVVVSHAREAA